MRKTGTCKNTNFPHTGEIWSHGLCTACRAYGYKTKNKDANGNALMRPASLIIAELERQGFPITEKLIKAYVTIQKVANLSIDKGYNLNEIKDVINEAKNVA